MSKFKIFLDNILIESQPLGLKDFEVEIIREDGFSSSDQILRDKTNTELSFIGDGYEYLASVKRNNFCGLVIVRIEFSDDGVNYDVLYNGIIQIIRVEFDINRCIAKSNIRDASFTGLIKDYTKTELAFYISRTKNCLSLSDISKYISFNGKDVFAFDLLDVFNYFISYITDNKIPVVSDTLTNNKIGLTVGYNFHNPSGNVEEMYPKNTFSKIFEEARKKRRLFMEVEYDANKLPYLRIEHESYFYNENILLDVDILPLDTTETTDVSRIFNSIQVGSEETELDSNTGYYSEDYVADPYVTSDLNKTWTKQTFNTCSECSNDSNSEQNKLDLVNDFIIDTDIIYEALNASVNTGTTTYKHDEDTFMFEYTDNIANYTLDADTGVYIYNAGFRNIDVLNEWFGYTPQCISLKNSTKNYFLTTRDRSSHPTPDPERTYDEDFCYWGIGECQTNILIDNANSLDVTGFVYTAIDDGSYIFKQSSTVKYIGGTDGIINDTEPTYTPFFKVYNSFNVLIDTYFGTPIIADFTLQTVNYEYQSPVLNLFSGYKVRAGLLIEEAGTVDEFFDYYGLYNTKWELIKDVSLCETTEDNTDSKPVQIEFSKRLCYSDFKNIRNDKKGVIEVMGNKYWIKNIKWNNIKDTSFVLIGNNSLV